DYSGGTYVAGPNFYNLTGGVGGTLNNPFGTVANGPTVVVANNSAFGSGAITLGGATVLSDAAGHSLSNTKLVLNGPVVFGGSSCGGSSSAGGNLTFNLSSDSLLTGLNLVQTLNTTTINGNLTGPGGLVMGGAGKLVLNGANTFTGGAVLNSIAGGIAATI